MNGPLVSWIRPILFGLATFAVTQTGSASPLHAQDQRSWEARHGAECRLAHQVLTTGQPAVRRDWALSKIRGCTDQGGEAVAAELRRLRGTEERTDELEGLVRTTADLVDRAIVEAALEVATDPSAGVVARVQSMRAISNQFSPATFITYEEFLTPSGIGTSGFIRSTAHPMVGEPLPRELLETVEETLAPLSVDSSVPESVRIAADNVAAQARVLLDACRDHPWFVYWGPC